jgi:hypothetical protein
MIDTAPADRASPDAVPGFCAGGTNLKLVPKAGYNGYGRSRNGRDPLTGIEAAGWGPGCAIAWGAGSTGSQVAQYLNRYSGQFLRASIR